ncbi:hypothetical protein NDU88_001954 [Pleurodeles waltl]|uniref:Uncharacterized protein n=1 Tax=Pleurodeles waltl TaxID=8319 RepID=A0AAV7QBK7_PLEWA|nr:hypothetical protein NDU88_001954 [Pleurodeles waltl]
MHRSECVAQGSASCTGQVVEQQQESASCTDECAAQGSAPCTVQVVESSRRVFVYRSECAAHGSVFCAQIRVSCTRQCSVHRAGRGAAAGERFVHRSECAAHGSALCTGQVVEQQQESASCTDQSALRRALLRAQGRSWSSRRVLCAQIRVRCGQHCSVHRAGRGQQ